MPETETKIVAKFDLEERTARFGEMVVAFAKQIRPSAITSPMISQLVRAGISVGANYCEADEADSKKEFRYRIGVSKREARETKHHIRMIVAADPALKALARTVWKEAHELNLIFAAIIRNMTR